MVETPPDALLSPKEVAGLIGVSADTVRRWMQDGYNLHKNGQTITILLSYVPIGVRMMTTASSVQVFIEEIRSARGNKEEPLHDDI